MAHIDTIMKGFPKTIRLYTRKFLSQNKRFHQISKFCSTCADEDSKAQIFQPFSRPVLYSHNKVSVIGVGPVGIAITVALLAQKVTGHVAMFDTNENRVRAEMLDLQHGSTFLNNPKIEASCNLKVIKNSRVCVLTVGESPTEPDSDMCALAKKNTEMIRSIVPFIFKYSPHTILLVVTSPVEAMTYACAQLADVPKHKIIGTGCNLDSTRLRFFMSQKYKVAGDSCKGWIVGESGPHSVVLWSTLTVGGVRLCSVNPLIGTNCDPENWTCIHQQVINADYELINLKGCVSWAVAGNAVDIIDSILNNTRKVFSVSVAAQSYYGICHNVYVSLPCVLGEGGVSEILTLPITDNEHEELLCAVSVIRKMQKSTCV